MDNNNSKQEEPLKSELKLPFGKTAILLGYITEDQLKKTLALQTSTHRGKALGEIMIEKNILTSEQVQKVLSRQYGKTMICPKCHRKYQIVAYQENRVYQCRDCPNKITLVPEKISTDMPQKAKTKKVDLLGLTQEFAALTKNKIDFADEPVASTKKILEHIGIDPILAVDYRKRPKARRKFNYVKLIIILLLLSSVGFIGSKFILKEEKNKPTDNSENIKQLHVQEMENGYKKIQTIKHDPWDLPSLKNKLALCENFLNQYSKSDYHSKIQQEMVILAECIQKIEEKKNAERKLENAIEEIRIGNYDIAESILQKILPYSEQWQITETANNIHKQLKEASQKKLDDTLLQVSNILIKYEYLEACNLIRDIHNHQISSNRQILEEKLEQIKKEQEEYLWIQCAENIISKIYHLLAQHDYINAISGLEEAVKNFPDYEPRFQILLNHLKESQLLWKKMLTAVEIAKTKKVKWELENKNYLEGNIAKYNPKTDMAYIYSKNGVGNILLSQVSLAEITKICEPNTSPNIPFICLILPWKGAKNLFFPNSGSESSQIAIIYLIAEVQFAAMSQKMERCQSALGNLAAYKNDLAWNALKAKVSEKIWAASNTPKISKKNNREFLEMLKIHFSDTENGMKAIEILKKK